jgi:sarcosine oxidase gamma subunit
MANFDILTKVGHTLAEFAPNKTLRNAKSVITQARIAGPDRFFIAADLKWRHFSVTDLGEMPS